MSTVLCGPPLSFVQVNLAADPSRDIFTIARTFHYPSRSIAHIPWHRPSEAPPVRVMETVNLRQGAAFEYTSTSSLNMSKVDLDRFRASNTTSVDTFEGKRSCTSRLMVNILAIFRKTQMMVRKVLMFALNPSA